MTSPDAQHTEASRRVTTTWLVATVLTIASWAMALAVDGGRAKPRTAVAVVGLGLAAVKVRLIVQEFMEVRTAPRWLRTFTDVWLAVLTLTILALYLAA